MATPAEIKKMYDAKMARFDKQAESIKFCWAVNNAVNLISSDTKRTSSISNLIKIVKTIYPKVIELYDEYFTGKPLTQFEIEEGQKKFDEMSQQLDLKTEAQAHEKVDPTIPIIEE